MSALPASPASPDSCSSAVASSARVDRLALEQPQQHPRVDAARAGRHHQPLERREAHRRVDRAAVGIAHSDAPAPRWQLTIRAGRSHRAAARGARRATQPWESPWKP